MFKEEKFTIFDWLVLSILLWTPGINILVAIIFIMKKGFLFTLKKALVIFTVSIMITLLLLAIFGI
jgi:hypothetical protein